MSETARPLRLTTVFPGFGVGGAQMRFVALARHFGSAIHHTIVALNGDTSCRERLPADILAEFPDAGGRQRNLAATLATATRVLRASAPDVVMTSNWGSVEWAMAARLGGFRHVHTEDGFGPEERDKQIPRRVITRRLALRRSCVVLPSRTLLNIATEIWKLPEKRLRYIPNGIDLSRFQPSPAGHSGPKVIGTIAALRPEKNIGRLIEAFAMLQRTVPSRLIIVGNGPERPKLEARTAELGISPHVEFAGQSDRPEDWLAKFDLFALSSDTEQMPLSVLEAMASGLPVASTDVGDVHSMLAKPHIAEKNPLALAKAMQDALADNDAGSANLERAHQEYGDALMFRRYGEVLTVPA